MSAIDKGRTGFSRWNRLAVAGLILASSLVVHAQSNEEKEKAKKTPPASQKNAQKGTTRPAGKSEAPAPPPPNSRQNVTTPPNTPPSRPPAVVNHETPPNSTMIRPSGGGTAPAARPVHADFHGANNTQVHFAANGQPRVVQAHGMTIVHTPSGVRQVVVERPDHTMIVTNGARSGFVQRPYVVGNVSFVQRTYFVGGVSYVRVYRPYMFGGISLNVYVPGRYYAPGFYMWAYNPWAAPVVYNWGWAGRPWYGFYGGWFTPYPSYANATFWLTDYVISMSLQQAYEDRMAAAAAAQPYPPGNTPITPDVKQQIADEVALQLNEERAAAQNPNAYSGVPAFLTDNSAHVFVVSSSLFLTTNGGGECPVTEGDVIQMMAPPPPGSPSADVVVLASKGMDCRRGSRVMVGITDLADMASQMRATIDQGLGVLQQHQGGIPAPPPAAQAPPVQPAYAAQAPPPDPNVQTEITQQAQSATQADSDALSQAQQAAPAGGSPTVSISLGMSIDDVVAAMGQPTQIADLGAKKTYFYANMKVIFTDGKVSDVQ